MAVTMRAQHSYHINLHSMGTFPVSPYMSATQPCFLFMIQATESHEPINSKLVGRLEQQAP